MHKTVKEKKSISKQDIYLQTGHFMNFIFRNLKQDPSMKKYFRRIKYIFHSKQFEKKKED